MEGKMAAGGVFRCPPDFEAVAECDGSVAADAEVWLIKAPADFTPQSFNFHRFPLSGQKMQKVKDGGVKKYYHVVSSPCAPLPLRAFLQSSGSTEDKLVAAAPLGGVITLAEAYGDHTAMHSVPDQPPVSLPQGLKQRYCPFGSVAPMIGKAKRGDSRLSESTQKPKKAKKRR